MFKSVRIASRSRPSVLIVGHFKGKGLDKASARSARAGAVARAATSPEATGELGRVVDVPGAGAFKRVLLVGLGSKGSFEAGSMRAVAAAAARRLALTRDKAAEVNLIGPIQASDIDPRAAGKAFGEGAGLIGWSCEQFRGSATKGKALATLSLQCADTAFSDGMKRGLALAESTNIARTLSQTPPNICTPLYLADQAKKMARETGLKCTVIKGAALEREQLQGLINVGKASENEPCLIRLEYTPEGGGKNAKPAVLLGKSMTYDSGGLSIKISGGMKGMKRDKDGGCAVLGAMHAIATVVRPGRPVVGLLVSAENAISDEAYRPDDVITFRNGVTVEVTNTDAEGRLVLADGLCWACDKENPAFIVDLATLTGGVVVALGKVYAGLWCDDDELRGRIECAAAGAGERVWRLPHHEDYRTMMKSPIADILNSAPVREAHPIQGAAFLSYFVKGKVPWAHIDIAGVHETDKDAGPFIAGPTGFGVRLLANLLSD
ncbi:MAG: leucyl aminopeptidase family protein [Planctomycetes bacterium]|nr:leucyl aminopeptidase family protein [Planctomycetota bacterium]